ncbi:MAG: cytochrome c maturation protein CcmE [Anaerolineae bacterium]|jgi:cytochrome c-type biogenesis protein CcmE|nr:cytochrome c maturation protein CcmE [Anaerolineae bacterium]
MSEITWVKTPETAKAAGIHIKSRSKYMYGLIGIALLAVVAFLMYNGLAAGRYYMTVNDLVSDSENIGKNVRVAGAVDGSTIKFDPQTHRLTFTVVHIPSDADEIKNAGGLGMVLHEALLDSNAQRLDVVWDNAEVPDLLQHEAQAIMTGSLQADGTFVAEEVLLKCPTRYSDEVPGQVAQE